MIENIDRYDCYTSGDASCKDYQSVLLSYRHSLSTAVDTEIS
jgi:hypothetical protein